MTRGRGELRHTCNLLVNRVVAPVMHNFYKVET
jgi:hypothetical protein